MKKNLLQFMIMCSIAFAITACGSPRQTTSPALSYEIECAGSGTQGVSIVKVWVYGNERNINMDVLKHRAVHGLIFRGYAGTRGCPAQRPMATNPGLEQERAIFFNDFFGPDKAYNRYASEVGGGLERVRVGREYKIGAVISVSRDLLRRDLQAAGVIRGLADGF